MQSNCHRKTGFTSPAEECTSKITRKLGKNCQRSRDHIMASCGSSQKVFSVRGPCTHSELRSLSHWHHIISKNSISGTIWFCLSSFHSLSGISGSPLLSLSSSRFTSIFDMVAEQADSGPGSFATSCPVLSSHDDSTTTQPTNQITSSSSGEKERSYWSSRLHEEPDIKMFSNDPKLNPRLPSPTSFDGVKPSYVEWSEEILTFLSVTDYQEFFPILQAVTGHKDVITKKVFIEGVLSETVEELKNLKLDLEAVSSGARVVDDQDTEIERINGEIKTPEEKRDSRGLTLIKAETFPQVCSASLDIRWSQHHGSSYHENHKLRFRGSHWSGNLASNGSYAGFSSNSSGQSSQADHDSIRMESWEVTKCSSDVSSLAGTHQQVWVTQFRKDYIKHQNHSSTSKCSWSSCKCPLTQYHWEVNMERHSQSAHQLLQQ